MASPKSRPGAKPPDRVKPPLLKQLLSRLGSIRGESNSLAGQDAAFLCSEMERYARDIRTRKLPT